MLKPYFCKLKKQQCIRRSATCWAQRFWDIWPYKLKKQQVDCTTPIVSEIWQNVLKPYFCKLKKQQCIRRSATCWAQRVDTQVDWPNSFWDMTKCLKPYFCKLKKQQCIRRSATCWAQRVDTQVDWTNSFWDMTKCVKTLFLQIEETTVYSAQRYLLSTTRWHVRSIEPIVSEIWQNVLKPYFCKLKKQQCIRRSATCWAQRVDTQVDWPNSFWDMTKCLKPYFCKLKKQQCIRRSATCWAQRVDTQVDWTNSFWDMTKCVKTLFLQIEETTVYSAQRYLLSTTRWHSGRLAQ